MGFRLPRRTLLAGGLLALACYSPTLPLPPPGEPEVSSVSGKPGTYLLVGQVEPHGDVFARNRASLQNYGELTGADGRYSFEVQGEQGDPMELWYVIGKDQSPIVTFELPPELDGAGGSP